VAGTVSIPLATLAVGRHDYPSGGGGVAVADADTEILLAIDRTVANGFNSQPATTTADYLVEQSNDGGATWFAAVGGTAVGGIVLDPPPPRGDGLPSGQSTVQVALYPGTGRKVRASVTVAGVAVAVAGTLTIS
jgi:hypothetical protein